jgi:hypothetical protein
MGGITMTCCSTTEDKIADKDSNKNIEYVPPKPLVVSYPTLQENKSIEYSPPKPVVVYSNLQDNNNIIYNIPRSYSTATINNM